MQHDINGTIIQAQQVMDRARQAFLSFRHTSGRKRAEMLEKIADGLEAERPVLVSTAAKESHLTEARLNGELSRTIGQLKLFASLVLEGSWVQASIDPALPERKPLPRTDIRKMLRPKGPVVVFGASNFPFAFSTLGGDTASALAAGCPVVIKAHPAHPATSEAVFRTAAKVIQNLDLPEDILQHVSQSDVRTGIELVKAKATAAVGFTGSFQAGHALMQAAAERPAPIEVFAEMSSTNPVVVLPDLLNTAAESTAKKLAASISLGVGQFCTNPGLIFIPKNPHLDTFLKTLKTAMETTQAAPMLHEGILASYHNNLQIVLSQAGVDRLVEGKHTDGTTAVTPSLATVTADSFLHNSSLKTEVFGPFSLVVIAENQDELISALQSLDGQLTASIFGSKDELTGSAVVTPLVDSLTAIAGRIIFNEVPTGVEVCHAMVHGGPFPSTSNSSYTSVGSSAILRWARPVCYQNFPDNLLPEELQNANPLGIWRQVNGEWSKSQH